MNSLAMKSLMICLLVTGAALAAEPWVQAVTQQALDSGFLQRLPPAISKTFGLAKAEDGTDVRELLAKDGHRIRTFNVSVANHNDVVIFNIDARAGANIAYLLSGDGTLRKAVSYQTGGSDTHELAAAEARAGLARESKFWSMKAKQKLSKQ